MLTFKWLPNLLTASRLVLVVPILILARHESWDVAFWFVIIAIATDFLDGLAAKTLNAHSRLGEHLDPLADFTLAAAGMAVIIFSGTLPLWVGIVMLVPALYIGYAKFVLPHDNTIHRMQPMFSVPYLFAVWIATAWYFAARAYGWSWWYAALTVVVLLLAAIPKRHRLRQWFAFVLDAKRR